MPIKCVLCGYVSEKGKRSFFAVPQNESLRARWLAQSPPPPHDITFTKSSKVCELHFRQEDVIHERVFRHPEGQVLAVASYKKPKLRENAVPFFSILNSFNPDDNLEREILEPKFSASTIEGSPSPENPEDPLKVLIKSEVHNPSLFDEVFNKRFHIELPPAWTFIPMEKECRIIFLNHVIRGSGVKGTAVAFKQICIAENDVEFNVMGHEARLLDLYVKKIVDVATLQAAIWQIHATNVCSGLQTEHNDVQKVAYRDAQDAWRAKKCQLFLNGRRSKLGMCPHCRIVEKSLEKKTATERRKRRQSTEEPDEDSTSLPEIKQEMQEDCIMLIVK